MDNTKAFIDDCEKNHDDSGAITMVDVLEEEQELEDDANAVLGASDDQNCTYPQGYVKRQALYACFSCTEESGASAGICLACSYACHEGHKLFELYTKRDFRCDCGNQKLSGNPCKLFRSKDQSNEKNLYNQNFRGVYCTCARPYPDPDDDIEDEMIQCVICEDWHHARHLGTPVPPGSDYSEMVCQNCMEGCNFLWAYQTATLEVVKLENSVVDKEVDIINGEISKEEILGNGENHPDVNRMPTVKVETQNTGGKSYVGKCMFETLPSKQSTQKSGVATFWPEGWRQKLCKCTKCQAMYTEMKVAYLLDDEDTVQQYEEQGKAKHSGESQYDRGMQALSGLGRVQQVEAMHEYNDMKSELKDFLKQFVEARKVVRKEDIEEFFDQMRARKRQRLEVSVPFFCR